ncbi:MAG TPA: rhodanese-like domain-containing protein [Chitinophagaceae bacterium]|nr:rhodanese-like domain-containing protein [Chitinophagaceae bacterium]
MLPKLFTAVFLLFFISVTAQYKNDNVLYKTVDPDDLCAALQKNSGYLLLDVRSAGENCDTSSMGLNIGHLNGAKNIDVRELGSRLSEIKNYKNQPVFVYCSHSQRSRRASKMLADSGFTKVYNINGGMTAIYYTNAREKDCLQSLVETNNKYAIISAADLCNKLSVKNNNVFILDVRNDSAFRHISTDAKFNAYGSLQKAVNIPLVDLEIKLSTIPKDKDIVIIDLFSSDAQKAASLLKAKGFADVSVLIEGISRWLSMDEMDVPCKNKWYVSPVSYKIMSTTEFGRFTQTNKSYLLLDIRTPDEFANKYKDSWRNIGHLKNAINIPAADINNRITELQAYKNKDIIIYGFSGDTESFAAADTLFQLGFKKIIVLNNGLFNIRWTAANHKEQDYLKDLVTDVPEINW